MAVKIRNVPSIFEFTFLNDGHEGFVPNSSSARASGGCVVMLTTVVVAQ